MKRYVETFFRHRLLLILPIIVAVVGASYYEYSRPRQYQTTASIWVDNPIPGGSSITQGSGAEAPSTAQADVLNELLQTHDFMLNVAKHSPMARYVATLSAPKLNGLLASMAQKDIKVAEPGPQIINITVQEKSPALARGLARAVVGQYSHEVTSRLEVRAQAEVTYAQAQVNQAKAAVDKVQGQLANFSPTSGSRANNSTETQLASSLVTAQQQLNQAQQTYGQATAEQRNVLNTSTFNVSDPPNTPVPVSRKKGVIFSAVGGLLGGLVISILMLAILTAADTAPREESDIEGELGLHVVGNIRKIPAGAGPQVGMTGKV